MKRLQLLLGLLFMAQLATAQTEGNDSPDEQDDTLSTPLILEVEETSADTFANDESSFSSPELTDSFFAAKIASIPSEIPLTYNPQVRAIINFYINKRSENVSRILGLKDIYFPIFESVFPKYNIPESMKYLAVIESALNPLAISRAGAAGMWQFMYSTGKMYDLDVNTFIDERRDPYKATEAAARHLRDLYEVYQDWHLVLAAYNSGARNVDKAIRRSGGKRDFWEISKYLPRETRGYVPAFMAAAYVMNFYYYHDIVPHPAMLCFDTICSVLVEKQAHFNALSKYLNLSMEELTHLNPELKKGIIPQSESPYWLNLPEAKASQFEQWQDSIFIESERMHDLGDWCGVDMKNKAEVIYIVKSGDNLGFIADWFDCRVQDIRLWNDIYKSRIKPRQQLRIYVPKEKLTYYSKFNKMSFAQKQRISGKTTPQQTVAKTISTPSAVKSADGKYIYHTVRNGDTLWDIAKLYSGVTVQQLKQINNIYNHKRLKPGMVLKIQATG